MSSKRFFNAIRHVAFFLNVQPKSPYGAKISLDFYKFFRHITYSSRILPYLIVAGYFLFQLVYEDQRESQQNLMLWSLTISSK